MTIEAVRTVACTLPSFRARVETLLVKVAVAVTNESAWTRYHGKRLALARQILQNPEHHVTRFGLAALTSETLMEARSHQDIEDSALEAAISDAYDSFAVGGKKKRFKFF